MVVQGVPLILIGLLELTTNVSITVKIHIVPWQNYMLLFFRGLLKCFAIKELLCQVLLSRVQITCESRTSITPYLNNWLFCTIKKPFQLVGCGCDASLYVLLFPPYQKCAENEAWKSSWIINNLLEVPVCCILEYFLLVVCIIFCFALQAVVKLRYNS